MVYVYMRLIRLACQCMYVAAHMKHPPYRIVGFTRYRILIVIRPYSSFAHKSTKKHVWRPAKTPKGKDEPPRYSESSLANKGKRLILQAP